ncbi:succinylglutamate desuccinylase/aspartoacylase family protein [Thalassoporum mexicanum]|uniref:succinylglutamate desuccinylase/aspartoacylase family protein n=1 Tax=Thalassoporum mexicanum TaxID=3457544 RepID=UPI00059F1211
MIIGGLTIAPRTRHRLDLPVARLPTQTMMSLPITVINGAIAGPRLWLSAAIHGDEINGVEIIRQVLNQINVNHLVGTLIAVPIINVFGFLEHSRYLPDRRDLNRCFPGSPRGSLAARIAHLFINEIVKKCTHGIDLHTAACHRINMPQIRANLNDPATYACAQAFAAPIMIHANTRDGSLRQAAANLGIPILLYEGGEALRFDPKAIDAGVRGILRVMASLGMYELTGDDLAVPESRRVEQTKWLRSPRSGLLHARFTLGQQVNKQQLLAEVTDAFGEQRTKIYAPFTGLVIGNVQNPLVNQGDGIIHLAVLD